jgi:two-component system chemotaxis response regulator CheY
MANHILVIDDERITQKLLAMHFQKLGYSVTVASTAREAMSLLDSEKFDLITCDWMMPEINGLEFLKLRKEHAEWQTIPIVMVSAASEGDELGEALEMGAAGIVRKPFTADDLKEMLKTVLGAEL